MFERVEIIEPGPIDSEWAAQEAEALIKANENLTKVDQMLREGDSGLPAIAVRLCTVSPKIDIPITDIHYGYTDPGKGFQPVRANRPDLTRNNGRFARKMTFGLSVPIEPTTRSRAIFYPVEYPKPECPRPSQNMGWWQQTTQSRYVRYMPDDEPFVDERLAGRDCGDFKEFTTWQVSLAPPDPFISYGTENGTDEADRAMRAVREKTYPWNEIQYHSEEPIAQYFIAVGHEAVKASLAALQDESIGKTPMSEPSIDMFAAVTKDLELSS